MHFKSTKPDSNHLVTVDWQIRTKLISVHSYCEFGCVRELLSSNFHITTADQNVIGIESFLLVRINVIRREDKTSLYNYCVKMRGAVNID